MSLSLLPCLQQAPLPFRIGFGTPFGFFLVLAGLALLSLPVRAEIPPMPPMLQGLQAQGVQLRYAGDHKGFASWVGVREGSVRYFHVSPDQQTVFVGAMMDGAGTEILPPPANDSPQAQTPSLSPLLVQAAKPPSRAEQFLAVVEQLNGFTLGQNRDVPVLHVFIDPNCPHCHDWLNQLMPALVDKGLATLRIIPVGFLNEKSLQQAAFLLTTDQPGQKLMAHIAGDASALPVDTTLNTQGIQRNMAAMLEWKVDSTPFTIYRARDGSIKVISGIARDLAPLAADLAAPTIPRGTE